MDIYGYDKIEKNGTIFYVDFYGFDEKGRLIYQVSNNRTGEGPERRATLECAKWARGLHGNAPSGTYYGRFRLILTDGSRISYPYYL